MVAVTKTGPKTWAISLDDQLMHVYECMAQTEGFTMEGVIGQQIEISAIAYMETICKKCCKSRFN